MASNRVTRFSSPMGRASVSTTAHQMTSAKTGCMRAVAVLQELDPQITAAEQEPPPPPYGGERGDTPFPLEVFFNIPLGCLRPPDERCRPICVNRSPPFPKGEGVSSAQSAPPLHGAGARHTHTDHVPPCGPQRVWSARPLRLLAAEGSGYFLHVRT